ncbi:MAG: lytic transglycosylase domain-containing protein [Usitatibacteraceae bacterium]
MWIALSALLLSAVTLPLRASCWQEAAARYQISPLLLQAIAERESALNPHAVSAPNADGSIDIGLMQINSKWLPTLAQFGITERQLHDGCTSTHVGAWILAQNFRRLGFTWRAVGAYNARDEQKRSRYARSIHRIIYRAPKPGAPGRS